VRLITLGVLLLIQSFYVHAQAAELPSSACPYRQLIQLMRDSPRNSDSPTFADRDKVHLHKFDFPSSLLVADAQRYSVIINTDSAMAWVRQYGGISGRVVWFGPFEVAVEEYIKCR
jgi:hypothetical protein